MLPLTKLRASRTGRAWKPAFAATANPLLCDQSSARRGSKRTAPSELNDAVSPIGT
jgi:hypothetical protein